MNKALQEDAVMPFRLVHGPHHLKIGRASRRGGYCWGDFTLEQLLDLFRRHFDQLLGEGEDLAHARPDEHVVLAAVLGVAPDLLGFARRTLRLLALRRTGLP